MSCTPPGKLWLKNATDGPIEILGRDAGDPTLRVRYRLAADEAQRVSVSIWLSRQEIKVRIANEVQCFEVPAIEIPWSKVGFFGPEVIAVLEKGGMLYLYRPDEDKNMVFTHPPPVQPAGFPLAPQPC